MGHHLCCHTELQPPDIFIQGDTFEWINTNQPPDIVILASPETSLFIPAYTGRRVIYGHPFETVNAQIEEQFVEDFFSNDLSSATDIQIKRDFKLKDIDLLFWGSREKELTGFEDLSQFLPQAQPVYQNSMVILYQEDP